SKHAVRFTTRSLPTAKALSPTVMTKALLFISTSHRYFRLLHSEAAVAAVEVSVSRQPAGVPAGAAALMIQTWCRAGYRSLSRPQPRHLIRDRRHKYRRPKRVQG